MPRYALIEDGAPREVSGAFTATIPVTLDVIGFPVPWTQESQFPPGWLEASTEEERLALGIREIVEGAPAPEGQQIASRALEVIDGVPTEVLTYEPIPAPGPPPVPPQVSRMQAKLALHAAGLLDDVETAIAGASREVQIYWAEVSELHRDHAILIEMTDALGWTSEQVDDLFRAAAAIR